MGFGGWVQRFALVLLWRALRGHSPTRRPVAISTSHPTTSLDVQDDWEALKGLTINVGLRYEYNQHMREVDNRLSAVDLTVPGGRYVIATNKDGTRSPASSSLLPLLPLMPGYLTISAPRCNAARTRKLPVVRPANR